MVEDLPCRGEKLTITAYCAISEFLNVLAKYRGLLGLSRSAPPVIAGV